MKKVIAWLLVLALTAAISIGATLAYLTDTDEDVNVMTLGNVKIDQLEYERVNDETANEKAEVQEFHDNKPLLPAVTDKNFDYTPGDTYVDWEQIGKDGYESEIWNPEKINNELDKMVFIKNKGKSDAYVRSVFAFEAGNYKTLDEFNAKMHLNLNETDYTWAWVETPVEIPNAEGGTTKYFVATATYKDILAPGALTEISLSQIALDKTATNEDVEAFGDTYQILVKSQGIQADGFDTAAVALDEGFGGIDANNAPWQTDAPEQGATVKNALHYLNADATTPAITTKVTSVTFGLTKNHADIANNYEGVLVTEEQDVPVYAYYVPNGSNYDVFLLGSDTIYAPTDCSNLCNGMSNLVFVDTSNLDVSRTTSMYRMFRDCGKLAEIDVSNWDTSNVTNMQDLFRACKSLPSVDVSNWNTGKVENMIATFQDCILMTKIDVSNWDTSNVTNMTQMFNRCNALKTLDVSDWNTGKVTSMYTMFQMCYELEELDVANWDVSNVTTFSFMFRGDANAGNMKLKALDVSKWNPVSADAMLCMFQSCAQLTQMDMSGWNMPKLTNAGHLFADCFKLEQVDLSGWNTPALVSVDAMFNNCGALQTVDLSDLDTANVKEFSQMFEYCYALETVVGMDKWDTSGAYTFDEMFSCCSSLKALDLSGFNTANARDNYKDLNGSTSHAFETMFNQVTSLEKLIVSDQIVYLGNGNVSESRKLVFPNPAAKEGFTAMWRNVKTGELFLGKDIPEKTAATYEAYYQYPAKGATMQNAIHYLNANTGSTKITTNVTSVTFGRTADYAEITSKYTGVLADQGQDGPVYAYYVLNGDKYDVYFLSDSKIYTPKNSTSLFEGMTALKTVDTKNLDVSRTENMYRMFRDCTALQSIDVGEWDTSNVTKMNDMFRGCKSLPYVDVSDWDVGKVDTMLTMFQDCLLMETIEVGNWDVSSVTNMIQMFNRCKALSTLDVSRWDVGNVTTTFLMFQDCYALSELATTNWDTGSLTTATGMFNHCWALKNLDVSKWDVSNVTDMAQMFNECKALSTLDVSRWDVGKVTNTRMMFNYCTSLKELDVSKWNTGSLTNMEGMFNHCEVIEVLDVSNWNVSNVTNMGTVFQQCWALKTLDVSKWDTSNVTDMGWMFYGCRNLEVIDISKWNVSNVTVMSHMFADCNKVKELKVDNWNVSKLQSMDATFNDCDSLTTINVSKWNTANVREFSQTFEGCDNLAQIIGLENWNTTNGKVFDEMFNACKSLKVLNLSSFNTGNVTPGFKNVNGDLCKGFSSTFAGMNSVEKIILGPNFRFAGNGKVTEQYQPKFPNPAPINGQATKWYNAANDTYYTAAEIPEPNGETVTYVAAIPPANP